MQIRTSVDRLINASLKENIPLVLWGAGEYGELYLSLLKRIGVHPVCFGDNNTAKAAGNVRLKGLPIYSAEKIKQAYKTVNVLLTVKRTSVVGALNTIQNKFASTALEVFILDDQSAGFYECLALCGRKKELKRRDFSILSNSCTAGDYYHYLGLAPNTPTQQLIIYPAHYLKLLSHLEEYLSYPLEFSHQSIDPRKPYDKIYPVGKLKDVELHFVHDMDFDVAYTRWNAGIKRINWEQLFVLFDDVHFPLSYKLAQEFDKLPYKNKIFLTRYDYPGIRSVCKYDPKKIWLGTMNLNALVRYERFDLIRWLNEGGQGADFEMTSITDDLPLDYVDWLYNSGMSINYDLNDLRIREIGG